MALTLESLSPNPKKHNMLGTMVIDFDQWLGILKAKVVRLGHAKSLAFAAACCERAIPNYEVFSLEEHWGNSKILRRSLDSIWLFIAEARNNVDRSHTERLLEALNMVTPDTENFKSILTSAALDAAISIAESLDYMRENSANHIVTVASLARDTVDMFLQHAEANIDSTVNSGEAIVHHPLMVAELAKQQTDVDVLESTDVLTSEFLARFQQGAALGGMSNLGIGPLHSP